jgi:hypothetical protein
LLRRNSGNYIFLKIGFENSEFFLIFVTVHKIEVE